MFAKFFRPKWQSSKADVRIRAISRMLADSPEEQAIISRLAQSDQDAEVRKAALARVVNPDTLLQALNNEPDPAIRQQASEQLCRLINSDDDQLSLEQRLHCINEIADEDLLTHIALNCRQAELQQAAVERVHAESNLEIVILNAQTARTRRLAATRLESEALLERLGREVRQRDKAVYRILRDKLQTLREAERERQALQQRRTELVERFEQLARGELMPQYGALVDALGAQWQELPATADSLAQRCEQAREVCHQRAKKARAEAEAREREAQQQRAYLAARETLLERLNELENQSAQAAAGGSLDAANLHGSLEQWMQDWQQLEHPGDGDGSVPPQDRIERIRRIAECIDAEARHSAELDQLLRQPIEDLGPAKLRKQQQRIEKLLQQIDWPANLNQPERLQKAAAALRQARKQREALQQQSHETQRSLESQLDNLAAAIDEGHVKQAGRYHQQATDALEILNGQVPTALDLRFKQLHAQLQELRDWQGFAVTPKKEQLCAEMEALIDSDLPAPERAESIRRLQQQWKMLDSTDAVHSQTLWRRFKEASDRAYAPCEEYFASLGELRRENLKQRTTICDQLDTYIASIDWLQPDWKGIETISRAAKQEWKQYAPVDRVPGREVQERFNALLQQLDGRLQEHYRGCLETKRDLVAKAAALCDADEPQEAAREARQLQQEWKAAGKTFRNQEQRLWKQFRGHCDTIFERLNDSQQRHRRQKVEQRDQAESLCKELEQLLETPCGSERIQAQLRQAREAFAALDSEFSEPCARRFESAATQLEQECSDLEQLRHSAPFAALEARIGLCDQLESLLGQSSAEAGTLESIQAQWNMQDRCNSEFADLIEQRYQLLNQVLREPELMPDLAAAAAEPLRQLCIQLEIELGLPSPEEDQAARLEYQMQRLQQALEQHNRRVSLSDLQRLEYEWRCIPLTGHHPALKSRFYGHLDGLL
ncbi:hypothetical protein GCM10011348_24780 [Marinobacterium nitratireducens]|uniref:DUF349 domain-containing protein n=1 Tax=Marinobacterium nitratireducens TaxID=518897 RepID=A0A918DUP4_9GAMM|nr:DUF349 domain-containing protein [Marinobacterium nitratireducens]GGO82739.1 hypothetical protein GCM10011348_24780 [Marinobacterium nitratireducens]